MDALKLSGTERKQLQTAIKRAEKKHGEDYSFVPASIITACSCTAHKKSCSWD